jgi:hypothetical protein
MVFRAIILMEKTHGVPHDSFFLRCLCCSVFIFPITEKLNCSNHPMWKMQVLSALRGAELATFISPTAQPPAPFLEPMKGEEKKDPPAANPNYAPWVAKDQQVLSFLLTSLSKEILRQIPTTIQSAKEA